VDYMTAAPTSVKGFVSPANTIVPTVNR